MSKEYRVTITNEDGEIEVEEVFSGIMYIGLNNEFFQTGTVANMSDYQIIALCATARNYADEQVFQKFKDHDLHELYKGIVGELDKCGFFAEAFKKRRKVVATLNAIMKNNAIER